MTKTRVALLSLLAAASIVAGCHHVRRLDKTMPGDYGLFLFSYALDTCPGPQAQLPSHGHFENLELEAGYLDGPYCHGYTKYRVQVQSPTGTRLIVPIYTRLQGSTPCALLIAMPTERLCKKTTLADCETYQISVKYADRLARALLDQAGFASKLPAQNMIGFERNGDFERWCEKRVENKLWGFSHPTFKKLEPGAAKPNAQ